VRPVTPFAYSEQRTSQATDEHGLKNPSLKIRVHLWLDLFFSGKRLFVAGTSKEIGDKFYEVVTENVRRRTKMIAVNN